MLVEGEHAQTETGKFWREHKGVSMANAIVAQSSGEAQSSSVTGGFG